VLILRCVAEAIVENGVRSLAECIPGGAAMYNIADAAWNKYRARSNAAEQREEFQRLAQASFEQAKNEAINVAREVASNQPDVIPLLELYLSQIPGSIRQSLKRPDDPVGHTVPANYSLRSADDLVKLLPPSLPRFRPGDPLPGKAGWVLDRQLGVGGFAEVWLARHPQFQSLVGAVKFCRNLQSRDRDLLHESNVIDRLLAHGTHANIVRLLDIHLEGDAPWLMYEYVDDGDLADLIHHWSGLPMTERQQKAIAALHALASAIGNFHRLEPAIVHRDLKPANILQDSRGRLRITDFGIGAIMARQLIESETRGTTTRAGRLQSHLYGSYIPLYASSQQRDGAEPDPRDDVHALGVIGYQMLTGHLGQGVGPDFVEDLQESGVQEALITLLRRCTAQKLERRPQDGGEVAEALDKLITKQPAAAALPISAQPEPEFQEKMLQDDKQLRQEPVLTEVQLESARVPFDPSAQDLGLRSNEIAMRDSSASCQVIYQGDSSFSEDHRSKYSIVTATLDGKQVGSGNGLSSCHFSEVSSPEESRQSSRQFIGKLAQLHEC
jgi:eukaryotic-like serine/threonine-protein kinase